MKARLSRAGVSRSLTTQFLTVTFSEAYSISSLRISVNSRENTCHVRDYVQSPAAASGSADRAVAARSTAGRSTTARLPRNAPFDGFHSETARRKPDNHQHDRRLPKDGKGERVQCLSSDVAPQSGLLGQPGRSNAEYTTVTAGKMFMDKSWIKCLCKKFFVF